MEEVPIDDEQTQLNRARVVKHLILWVWIGANALMLLTASWPRFAFVDDHGTFDLSLDHVSVLNQLWVYPLLFVDLTVLVLGGLHLILGILPYYGDALWRSYKKTGGLKTWRQELRDIYAED